MPKLRQRKETVIKLSQDNIKNVCDWLKGMDIHPQKCQVMHANNTTKMPPIKMGKMNQIPRSINRQRTNIHITDQRQNIQEHEKIMEIQSRNRQHVGQKRRGQNF